MSTRRAQSRLSFVSKRLSSPCLPSRRRLRPAADVDGAFAGDPIPGTRPPPRSPSLRQSPVIDGNSDDAIWATAQVFDAFRTFDPVENGEPLAPKRAPHSTIAICTSSFAHSIRIPHRRAVEPARRPHAVRMDQADHRRLSRPSDGHRARGESRRREARLRDSQRRRRRRFVGRRVGRRHAHRFTRLGRGVSCSTESIAICARFVTHLWLRDLARRRPLQ